MTAKSEVYKCNACGAIIAVITGGRGELVGCDQKMVEVTPDKAKKLIHDMARPGTPEKEQHDRFVPACGR